MNTPRMLRHRTILALLALYGLGTNALGQCGFDTLQRIERMDPAYREAMENFDRLAQAFIEDTQRGGGLAPLEVPVVVHVVHKGEPVGAPSNPTDSAIMAALECVNARFAGTLGTGVDTGISFCLAQLDPDGQPTNGIDRIDGSAYPNYATWGLASSGAPCTGPTQFTLSQDHGWPLTGYYNIYLVHYICGSYGGGFAYLPSPTPIFWDGAYIPTVQFNCTSGLGTHELGHGMGLYHTFEGDGGAAFCPPNTDCTLQGDRVCDTPPHKSSDCSLLVSPCNTTLVDWENSCTNFMSYCLTSRFTAGQRDRMHFSILNYRSGLTQSYVCYPDSCLPVSAPYDRELSAASQSPGVAVLRWNNAHADAIDLRYRQLPNGSWTLLSNVPGDSLELTGLPSCTSYEFQIEVVCSGTGTGFSPSISWTTPDCPDCTGATYCVSQGVLDAWIESVSIGTYQNVSGEDFGYAYFDGPVTTLYAGLTYTISVTPGADPLYLKAWCDFNSDGAFDASELTLDPGTVSATTVSASFTVPPNAVIDATRLRIAGNSSNAVQGPCQSVTFGETEDYCVLIGELSTGLPTQANTGNVAWPNPADTWVEWRIGEPVVSVDVFDLTGRKLRPNVYRLGADGVRIEVGQLANGEYILRAVLRHGSSMQRLVVQH